MRRWLRRLTALGLLGGAAGFFVRSRKSKDAGPAADAAWPPLRLVDPIPPDPAGDVSSSPKVGNKVGNKVEVGGEVAVAHGFVDLAATGTDGPSASWLAPVDGACPATHPIKANDQSGIFHVPGGRSYERTIPERCYATPEAAIADGYRQAKV